MFFLKDIVKLPFLRNQYVRYAKRYGINFKYERIEGVKHTLITKEQIEAIRKIYYDCDCPKYKDLKNTIDNIHEYFTKA